MYYFGIDGGGTKTAFALMDDKGNILAVHESSGCYYLTIGKEGLLNLFLEGIEKCFGDIPKSEAVGFAAIPAYSELADLDAYCEEMKAMLPFPFYFGNDVEAGYAGALALEPGINIVAGTGSICIGTNESGQKARSGGWGYIMDCDEGSAYSLGLRMIQEFTRQADFRKPRTLLYDMVRSELGFKSDFDLFRYMYYDINMERDKVAKLSMILEKIYRAGDSEAIRIYNEGVFELYSLAKAITTQIKYDYLPVKVSYSGGVFKAGSIVLEPLASLLAKSDMVLFTPLYTPVIGSCLLALKNSGNILTDEIKSNLNKETK